MASSLMVACLKRLLPVGLNLFAGREQEMVQHAKDRYLKVGPAFRASCVLCQHGSYRIIRMRHIQDVS